MDSNPLSEPKTFKINQLKSKNPSLKNGAMDFDAF
jgi:hypothetical protein